MRFIRNWLIAFGICIGFLFVVAIHFYFILAIATVLHDFDHITEFGKYQQWFLGGAVLLAVALATLFASVTRE